MNEIHIWSFPIDNFSEEYYQKLVKNSPSALIKEVAPYRKIEDKIRKIIGRLLLQKAIVKSGLHSSFYEKIKKTDNNKPYLDNWYNYNVSYSEQFVVFCFSPTIQIGIDIEYKKPIKFKSIANSFHTNERKKITQSAHPLIDFYDIWVRKEAVLKAEGIGLLDGLDTVDCTNDFICHKNKKWVLKEIEVDENYICYIAHNHTKTIPIHKSIDFTELFT